jgi:hypothetical protein
MSSLAISPVASVDYGSAAASTSQQGVLQSLIQQLQQSISNGDLTNTQTYLNAVESLSPSSAAGNNALGSFLTAVGTATSDGSVSEAQSALAAYQSATSTAPASTDPTGTATVTASSVANGLVLSKLQLSLVSSLLGGNTDSSSAEGSTTLSQSLLNILNAAYGSSDTPAGAAGSSGAGTAIQSSTPYDALVSAIQSSLSAGTSPASALLDYLSPTGTFLDTYA